MNARHIVIVASLLVWGGCKKQQTEEDDFDLSDAPAKAQEAAKPVEQAAAPAAAPVMKIRVASISTAAEDIKKGQEVFAAKGCPACHKIGGGKLVGPDLKGVTARRQQAWVESMIVEPDRMLREDADAKELLKVHMVPMPNQGVNADTELPFILAYLKSVEK